jgi:hypothetical protein
MKKLLPSVLILGIRYKIIMKELDNLYGEMIRGKNVIHIDYRQPPELMHSTLFHECIHSALYTSGVSELLTDEQEEAICIALESAFAKAIDFNKLRK